MIAIKEAVQRAVAFAAETLGERAKDLRLEEVDSTSIDGADCWVFTLSMQRPLGDFTSLSSITLGRRPDRDFKTFTIDKQTGEIKSMKIREFAVQ